MKYTKFKQIAKRKSVHLWIDLDSLEQVKEGQKILVKDSRTVREGNRYKIKPVAVSEDGRFYVVCPVCGEIHRHTLDKKSESKGMLPCGCFSGSRNGDCIDPDGSYDFEFIIA